MSATLLAAPLLSQFQANVLLAARKARQDAATVSLDLNLSTSEVTLTESGVLLPNGFLISWDDVARISENDNACFELTLDGPEAVREFCEQTQKMFQLMPTAREPALLISGFVMHRIRDVSPQVGAQKMVAAVVPFKGRLLDTATGLGYAAIAASRLASEVVTIEFNVMAQQMAHKNPWSRALFETPNIEQMIGNSAEVVPMLKSESFQAVVHDPPAMNIAGDLYSESFYEEVHRVLGRGGKFFHYIGDPKSTSGGRVTQGVQKRLRAAGFKKVIPQPDAFGLLALK